MRQSAFAALFFVWLAACGGSDPTGTNNNNNNNNGGPDNTPTTIAMHAGNGQTAVPGEAVATNPAVVVRNSSNQPLAGIQVTFAIDAGGGSLLAPTATTGSDGVATVGRWTLGAAAGTNRLKATVAALTPVLFTAEGVAPPTAILVETDVPPTGGTVTVQKPGDPLDGLSLSIPGGSFSGLSHWKFEKRELTDAPTRPGLRPVVVFSLATNTGVGDSLMTMTIPVHVASDSVPNAFLYNVTNNHFEAIPIVGWTENSVTIASRHFNSTVFLKKSSAAFALGDDGPQPTTNQQVILNMVSDSPASALAAYAAGGVDTHFEPTLDMWEFGNFASYLTPVGQATGSAISSIYYYLERKSALSPIGLFGRYSEWSYWAGNPGGYRIAAIAESDIKWAETNAAMKKMDERAIGQSSNPDVASYMSALGAMALTARPQVFLTNAAPGVPGFTALIAYKMTTSEVWVANPNNPGQTIKIPFNGGNFGSVQISHVSGAPTYAANRFRFAGLTTLIKWTSLAARFDELQNGRVGDDKFPAYTLQYWDEPFGIWKNFPAGDSLRIGWETVKLRALCPSCQRPIPGDTPGLMALDVIDRLGTKITGDRTTGGVSFTMPNGDTQVGVHILGGQDFCTGCLPFWGHVDFRVLRISTSRYFITPENAVGITGSPVQLIARHSSAPSPRPVRYDWTFAHFGGDQTVQTYNDSTVQHTWNDAGTFGVLVVVKDSLTLFEIGRASMQVNVGQALPIWRMTELAVVSAQGPSTLDPYHIGLLNALNPFEALGGAPQRGLIYYRDQTEVLQGVTYRRGAYVQVQSAVSSNVSFDPTRPTFRLATAPTAPPFAPDHADALNTDTFTDQGVLTAGTFSGRSVNEKRDMTAFPGGTGIFATLYFEIEAVKNGTQLAGTIRRFQPLHEWIGAPGCTCVQFPGTVQHVWTFKATRVQ